MEGLRRKFILTVFIVLSLFVLIGNSWAEIELPHAFFGGMMETYLDNGVNDDLVFMYSTIENVVLDTGLNPTDSIMGATVAISGSKRNPLATPGTTFTDATLTISNGTTTFFTGTLKNIEFVLIDGLWRLNPDLDINDPPTLNLEGIILNPGPVPSDYILQLQAALGSQSIAGMMMTLYTYSGDITGDSQSAILEGLIDGVPAAAPNTAPIADAGATTTNTTCLATSCDILLDGSQSSDPDSTPGTNDNIVSFEWFENSAIIGTGETVQVTFPLGMHDITLRVTDAAGEMDETTITIVIDPAELSFLEITKAEVFWNYDWIQIKGKLALPAGVSHESINSVGSASISLSGGLGEVVYGAVDFEERRNGRKWRYHDSTNTQPIHWFKIDWDGAKFDYQQEYLKIKSHHFGDDSTTLEVEFCNQFMGPADIVIGSVTVSIAEDHSVTVSGATSYEIDLHSSSTEVEILLPFDLGTLTSIDVAGTPVNVADFYTAAVGKFKIKASFDSLGVDPDTIDPKELALDVRLGDEGFSGILVIDNDTWTKITNNKWKYRAH